MRLSEHSASPPDTFIYRLEIGIVVATILCVVLVYAPNLAFPYHSPKTLAFCALTVLATGIAIVGMALRTTVAVSFQALDIALGLRVMMLFILCLFLPDWSNGLNKFLLVAQLTAMSFVIKDVLVRGESRKIDPNVIVIGALVVAAICETLIALPDAVSSARRFAGGELAGKPLIQGTLGNPNSVAGFLATCLPYAMIMPRLISQRILKWILWSCCCLIFFVILATLSRGAWVGLGCGTLVYLWRRRLNLRRLIHAHRIMSISAIPVVAAAVGILGVSIVRINTDSVVGRLLVWEVSAAMVADAPLTGIGYGGFGVKYLDYQGRILATPWGAVHLARAGDVKQAHNEFLEVFAEEGLVGIVLFMLVIIQFLVTRRNTAASPDHPKSHIHEAILWSGIVVIAHSLVDSPLHVLPIAFVLYLDFGLMSRDETVDRLQGGDRNPYTGGFFRRLGEAKGSFVLHIPQSVRFLVIAGTLATVVYAGFLTISRYHAMQSWQEGIDSALAEDWSKAIDSYEESLPALKGDGRLLFNLGGAYLNHGDQKKAIILLNESLKSFQDKNTYVLLGFAHTELLQFKEAETAFNSIAFRLPNLLLPHLLLGNLYAHTGREGDARRELEKVLQMTPKLDNELARQYKNEAGRLLFELDHTGSQNGSTLKRRL